VKVAVALQGRLPRPAARRFDIGTFGKRIVEDVLFDL